jgi:hypothetical protein
MADTITPTQPLAPTLPVTVPPEDKRREKKKPSHENDQEQTDSDDNTKKPHKGLFDEYV